MTLGDLSSEVLLNIFLHCLDDSPRFWPTLVHVCQIWRRIIFTSPRTLYLRLICKHGTPVLKTLSCWPALPITVQYGGSPTLEPPSCEDEENVMAALEQSDRVSSISLTITSSLLAKFQFFPIGEPLNFSGLENLVLRSQNPSGLAFPSTFEWGSRLRHLHSTGIAFPALPRLLLPSVDLVDLQLHEVPGVGYFSPEAFAIALSGMTQLQTLSLHFLSPASRPRHIVLSPAERFVLPALTHLKFRGASEYLNSLVARIDAPGLVDFEIRFFNQLIFHLSELGQFINRIEMQRSHRRANIAFSGHDVSIFFTQPGVPARLTIHISCDQFDWQLSSMAQICGHEFPFLSSIQDLRIVTPKRSSLVDDVSSEQWLDLVRGFDGAKDFHVAGELAADILRALRPVDGGHTTVLPSLQKLLLPRIASPKPLQDAVESFTTLRRLSGHPVQEYPPLLPIRVQEHPPAPCYVQKPPVPKQRYVCNICSKHFAHPQGRARHIKDKHMPQNTCSFCSVFKWSPGRKYLYRRHLRKSHRPRAHA